MRFSNAPVCYCVSRHGAITGFQGIPWFGKATVSKPQKFSVIPFLRYAVFLCVIKGGKIDVQYTTMFHTDDVLAPIPK